MDMARDRRQTVGHGPFDRPPIVGHQEIGPQPPQNESAVKHRVERRSILQMVTRQRNVEISVEPGRGCKIIIQRDHGVAESLAKMVDYANHAKWYAADPEAREDVENVLAQKGGGAGADAFG